MMSACDASQRPGRRVLIVTPSFPPANMPDMQRVRMSLPHYSENGWEAIVLTVAIEQQEGIREDELLATIPPAANIHTCGAVPLACSRLLGLRNLGLRAWWHLLLAGGTIIRREKIDLIFFSNTHFVTFALGRIWRFLYRIPYVVDLQDPWRTDYYEQPGARKPPGGWKYQVARIQARFLEGWSFRKLSGFISVSDRYITDLCARYPWFRQIPSVTIPFGTSEMDLRVANAIHGATANTPAHDIQAIRLVYTGAAGPITPHAADVLLHALHSYRKRHPEKAARLRLEFHGTSYAPAGRAQHTILPLAREHGVEDLVFENPVRIGHLEALRLQAGADALLLAGSADPAYSPSKLYPYFLANRPILCLTRRNSVLAELVMSLNCAHLAYFEPNQPNNEAIDSVCEFFEHSHEGFPAGTVPLRNEELFRREYLAPALTARQCALFDAAISRSTQ